MIFLMSTTAYLMHILYGNSSEMNSELILVIIPVISITVLMLGLRSILLEKPITKLKKQK